MKRIIRSTYCMSRYHTLRATCELLMSSLQIPATMTELIVQRSRRILCGETKNREEQYGDDQKEDINDNALLYNPREVSLSLFNHVNHIVNTLIP